MSDEFGGGWMAAVAARYQVKVTTSSPLAGANRLLVAADPRRWYLRIASNAVGGTAIPVAPGPQPPGGAAVQSSPGPFEVKFRDAPALCVGEWWVNNGAAISFTVWEVLYVGD